MLEEAARKEEEPVGLVALTPRELEVLRLISFGLTNAEAARRLHVSVHAIKFHLAAVYSRLGVANRTEASAALRAVPAGRAVGLRIIRRGQEQFVTVRKG